MGYLMWQNKKSIKKEKNWFYKIEIYLYSLFSFLVLYCFLEIALKLKKPYLKPTQVDG